MPTRRKLIFIKQLAISFAVAVILFMSNASESVSAERGPIPMAFLHVEFLNDNAVYEPTSSAEAARMEKLAQTFKAMLSESRRYKFVPVPDPFQMKIANGQALGNCAGCEFKYGRQLGVEQVAWIKIQKVSNLISNINLYISDVQTRKFVFAKSADMRGNTDETWLRSLRWIVKNYLLVDIASKQVTEPSPTRIAVFDFELIDNSAGGGIIAQDAIDTENLKLSTEKARRMLVASGRYSIVDTSSTASKVTSAGGIRNCNGCEGLLAKKLGADRSLIGLITRINRTEYTLQILVRDTQTGAVVSNVFTGLRMGANYAWPRGVKWLMKNKVLPAQHN